MGSKKINPPPKLNREELRRGYLPVGHSGFGIPPLELTCRELTKQNQELRADIAKLEERIEYIEGFLVLD